MRTFAGYIAISCIVAVFFTTLFFSAGEVKKAGEFQDALESKVNKEHMNVNRTSLMKDEDGRVFSEINRPFRLYTEDEDIPDFAKDIIITSEDQNFYEHVGFDAGAILRAVVKNLVFTHIQQGGSTITQQLARNMYLGQEKTYNRKLTELFYAGQIEKNLTKDEIMEMYLNVIYFSNGVYGIGTASQYYFSKPVTELNQGEISFLASIPNNPGKYDPIKHFDETKKRQERLLELLVTSEKLTEKEAVKIKKTPIHLKVKKAVEEYPDYAFYVEHELKELIGEKEGFADELADAGSEEERDGILKEWDERFHAVISSGVIINTALDPAMQKKSTKALNDTLESTELEGASASIDNKTRKIVAITGGKNYKEYNFHHAFQAFRQPGSAIKPLLVYGPYMEKLHPSLQETIDGNQYCIKGYCPVNYGNASPGMVTISQAFAQSYNGPALRMMEKVGVDQAFEFIRPFHFQKVSKEDKTFAASVGGFTYGMSPLEMTDAYTSFIDGEYTPARAITDVTDSEGNLLYQWKDNATEVWSKSTTAQMRSLLHQGAVSGTGKPAYVSRPYVGIKTGTTNQYHDFWVMGLTDRYTTGVWVGHDTPENMSSIESWRPGHRIWKQIMK